MEHTQLQASADTGGAESWGGLQGISKDKAEQLGSMKEGN